jgi:hypothetical protein
VTTRPLAAVGRTGREASVALAADLLVAVVLGRKHLKRRLDDTATETEYIVSKSNPLVEVTDTYRRTR